MRRVYLLDHRSVDHLHPPAFKLETRSSSIREMRLLHLLEDLRRAQYLCRRCTEYRTETLDGSAYHAPLDVGTKVD